MNISSHFKIITSELEELYNAADIKLVKYKYDQVTSVKNQIILEYCIVKTKDRWYAVYKTEYLESTRYTNIPSDDITSNFASDNLAPIMLCEEYISNQKKYVYDRFFRGRSINDYDFLCDYLGESDTYMYFSYPSMDEGWRPVVYDELVDLKLGKVIRALGIKGLESTEKPKPAPLALEIMNSFNKISEDKMTNEMCNGKVLSLACSWSVEDIRSKSQDNKHADEFVSCTITPGKIKYIDTQNDILEESVIETPDLVGTITIQDSSDIKISRLSEPHRFMYHDKLKKWKFTGMDLFVFEPKMQSIFVQENVEMIKDLYENIKSKGLVDNFFIGAGDVHIIGSKE